ncbi:MAG TPA: SDR family oxidoreductase [Dyella sp.]|uniref:SDR family oxidoreductase n=1 Tax=Dyella sp. TaxID=1869338 RepID=UPI002F93B2B1
MRKTALITGGAQGIGLGIVDYLVQRGWLIGALDLDTEAVDELGARHGSDSVLALGADVADEEGVAQAFQQFDSWQRGLGEPAGLDLLVNNAGVANPHSGPIESLTLDRWRRWQDGHVTGAFLCARSAVPRLRERKGSIVNIASTRAVQSEPHCEAYAAAKGALLAFTHALAISLGPDIRANVVLPGWIETGPWKKASQRSEPHHRDIDKSQHPVGRIGEPADIAAAVLYLAEAGFVTGQQFAVDGGMTRKMIYAE